MITPPGHSPVDKMGASFDVVLFPNPADDLLNVRVRSYELRTTHSDLNFAMFDIFGKVVLLRNFDTAGRLELDVSGLLGGVYFAVVRDVLTGEIVVEKVVVE